MCTGHARARCPHSVCPDSLYNHPVASSCLTACSYSDRKDFFLEKLEGREDKSPVQVGGLKVGRLPIGLLYHAYKVWGDSWEYYGNYPTINCPRVLASRGAVLVGHKASA